MRKYIDLGQQAPASLVLRANTGGVEVVDCLDRVGYPFFGQLVLDVLNRTETAMSQQHIFKAAELSMQAQALAERQAP